MCNNTLQKLSINCTQSDLVDAEICSLKLHVWWLIYVGDFFSWISVPCDFGKDFRIALVYDAFSRRVTLAVYLAQE